MTFNIDDGLEPSGSMRTGRNSTGRLGARDARRSEVSLAVLGRYQILSQLGKGGFGLVYLAEDHTLMRKVAIKVPRWDKELGPEAIHRFLREGQVLAQVSHPGIVTVHDYGVTDDDVPYVVMQYVEGQSLSSLLKSQTLEARQTVHLLMRIAEALHAAHRKLLTHRDLKPSNIIVDAEDGIHIVDFGLALHDDLTRAEIECSYPTGTPVYMAPEQMRGENHLIDCRTDIWAFGVILYQMLVGGVPFRNRDVRQLFRAICYRNPRRPGQVAGSVPEELERICLRCLQKQMDDRYPSMQEVLDELRAYEQRLLAASLAEDRTAGSPTRRMLKSLADLPAGDPLSLLTSGRDESGESLESRSGAPGSMRIVPRGLRSFDQSDADFYLRLLPGPVDREGIPETVRFWKARIDPANPVERIPVGLIYGPSGCGKSSFVRAGLIPHLSRQVLPVYIDCTTDDLHLEIEDRLRREIPALPEKMGLADILQQIRLGNFLNRGDRLVLVLDQFEQWLSRHGDYSGQVLTEALRQCDGLRLQSLLLVRDDFWLSVSQFFHALQQRIEDRSNSMALPLLDERHARHVLESYGRAYGSLPPAGQPLARSQLRFIREAVRSVADQGRVICVHLSVFAETSRNREWDMGSWRAFGGWEGIGREYIAGVFNDPATPGFIRQNSGAAWRMLAPLLPTLDRSIRGPALTRQELMRASGMSRHENRFDQLLDFLQFSARLVSPIESSASDGEPDGGPSDSAEPRTRYGLTHDFLVRPIRAWGMAKQNETRTGRAASLLQNLAEQWKLTGDRRFLPGNLDFWRLLAFCDETARRGQAEFWRAARRLHLVRLGLAVAFCFSLAAVFWIVRTEQRQSEGRLAVARFLNCPSDQVARHWPNVFSEKLPVVEYLRRELLSSNPAHRFRSSAALLGLEPNSPSLQQGLLEPLAALDGPESLVLNETVRRTQTPLLPLLRKHWQQTAHPLMRARLGLSLAWQGELDALEANTRLQSDPVSRTDTILELAGWNGRLGTLVDHLQARDRFPPGDLLSALFSGLGLVPPAGFAPQDVGRCAAYAREIYLKHPHAGAHSAAWFLLKKWGMEIPSAENADVQGAEWRHHSVPSRVPGGLPYDLMLIRIPAGETAPALPLAETPESGESNAAQGSGTVPQSGSAADRIKNAFWISAFEIPERLFEEYCLESGIPSPSADAERPEGGMPAPGNAVGQVDFWAAAGFCNWLSEATGHPKRYRMENGKPVLPDPGRSGIRLPTSAEFEYAHRAKSSADFYFGSSEHALNMLTGAPDQSQAGPSGQYPPNGYGVFDLTANYREWTETRDPTRSTSSFWIDLRGANQDEGHDERKTGFRISVIGVANVRFGSIRVVLPQTGE